MAKRSTIFDEQLIDWANRRESERKGSSAQSAGAVKLGRDR